MRAFVLLMSIVALLLPFAAAAQDVTPTLPRYAAADSAAFASVRVTPEMLFRLANARQIASVLQPTRVTFNAQIRYGDYFPLDLLDIELPNFAELIQPWLGDEIGFVYRDLSTSFGVETDAALWMLETNDYLRALTSMRPVIEGQDLPDGSDQPDTVSYQDTTIYLGDKAAFAFTPEVVLVGSEAMIRQALDVAYGGQMALAASESYQALAAAVDPTADIFFYTQQENAAGAFGALVGNCEGASGLLNALGSAVGEFDNRSTLESSLLRGAVDAIGASAVFVDGPSGLTFEAQAVVHTTLSSPVDITAVPETLLRFLPRNAAAVHLGTDAENAAYTTALSLPLTNFASCALGAFPVQPTTGAEVLPAPGSADLLAAFNSLQTALQTVSDVDLEAAFATLNGPYAAAVIPRPNSALPIFNTPFDLLLVAQVDDGEAALSGFLSLLQNYFPAEAFVEETIGDAQFSVLRLAPSDSVILSIGLVDQTLMIATGAAVNLAMAAQTGDNQLIDTTRWQQLSTDQPPTLYVDLNPLYNTLFPQAGGMARLPADQVGLTTEYLGDGLFSLEMRVTLPGG